MNTIQPRGLVDSPRPTSNGVKRILIFSLAYTPYVGGAELSIKEITDRLDPAEYEFDMVTLRFDEKLPRAERVGNITVHRIGFTARDPKVSARTEAREVLIPVHGVLQGARASPGTAVRRYVGDDGQSSRVCGTLFQMDVSKCTVPSRTAGRQLTATDQTTAPYHDIALAPV